MSQQIHIYKSLEMTYHDLSSLSSVELSQTHKVLPIQIRLSVTISAATVCVGVCVSPFRIAGGVLAQRKKKPIKCHPGLTAANQRRPPPAAL